MESAYQTDWDKLTECVVAAAVAMKLQPPANAQVARFLKHLVLATKTGGGKEILPCLEDGLITEVEACHLVMAHAATWLQHEARTGEPSSEPWGTPALELQFEVALLGRPAHRTETD